MTPEAQRIAIAEACGWRWLSSPDGSKDPNGEWRRPDGHRVWVLPNYPRDLNAMHEAEKVLDVVQRRHYVQLLHPQKAQHFLDNDWEVAHATATQRAEAFLRTIGKWEDSK